jgi:Head binding
MSTLTTPYNSFNDSNGSPLENGSIYIGTVNQNPQTNPISVYWDAAFTTPAVQPIKTAGGYPVRNGTPARVYVQADDYSIAVRNSRGVLVYYEQASTAVQSLRAELAASSGAALVGWIQSGTGAVPRTVQNELRLSVNVTQFGADPSYSAAVNNVAIQAALDAAWTQRKDVFIPGGTWSVTGLILPGTYPTLDERDHFIRIYGQGSGNPFSTLNSGGTVLLSTTNAPIFTDRSFVAPNAQGTYEIDHIRFDGTSATPVVQFYGLYGTASFHNNVIYQRGVGDGLKVIYGATGHVYENYCVNKDFATIGLGAARTGIGFNFPISYGSGLTTFRKNSSRGFLTGYAVGGGAGISYSAKISECEASTVYNGFTIAAGSYKTVIEGCYLEGGEGGVGILDAGLYSTIVDTMMFPGFLVGIDASNTTNYGTVIENNLVSMGAVASSTGVNVSCNASVSIGSKAVTNNTILYTAGTLGCTGLALSGSNARINNFGNAFGSMPWTGAGSNAVVDSVVNGTRGYGTGINGSQDFPKLNQGAISFSTPAAAFTQADVTANKLIVPDGSYFLCSATAAASVLLFDAGVTSGRYVTFRTTTANMSFGNSAFNKLAGAVAFTGPGTITFLIDRVGANNFGYEVSRTTF